MVKRILHIEDHEMITNAARDLLSVKVGIEHTYEFSIYASDLIPLLNTAKISGRPIRCGNTG